MATARRDAQIQRAVDAAVKEALAQAQAGLVAAQSKPDLIDHLRRTWRKSAEHAEEQAKRFVRLTALAAAPSLFDLLKGGHFDKNTLWAFAIPVLEVAYRQMFPALGAKAVDSADGATIVPDQVGAETVQVPAPDAVIDVAVPEGDAAP